MKRINLRGRSDYSRLSQCVLLTAVMLWAMCQVAYGTTVFWMEYKPDERTVGLWHCENIPPQDESSLGQSSEVLGNVSRSEGKFGEAFHFGSISSAVKISLKKGLTNEGIEWLDYEPFGFTIEAWINLDKYPSEYAYILARPGAADKRNDIRFLVKKDGTLVVECGTLTLSSVVTLKSNPGIVPLKKWVHIAASFAGSHRVGNTGRLYLNGIEIDSLGLDGIISPAPDKEGGVLYIGNDNSLKNGFPGSIDEVRIRVQYSPFYPQPDNTWTDPEGKKEIVCGAPYLPGIEDILFYAPLDGSADPRFSVGEGKPTKQISGKIPNSPTEALWVPGVHGKAYLFGDISIGFGYQREGNLDLHQGALELWVMPVNWNNTVTSSSLGFGMYGCQLYTVFTPFQTPYLLTFYVLDIENRAQLIMVSEPAPDMLRPEQWRHIVVNWKGQFYQIFVDGKLCRETIIAEGFEDIEKKKPGSFEMFFLGYNVGHPTVMDEFYIYKRPLLPIEVKNAYLRYINPEAMIAMQAVAVEVTLFPGKRQAKVTVDISGFEKKADVHTSTVILYEKKSKEEVDRIDTNTFVSDIAEVIFNLSKVPKGEYQVKVMLLDSQKKEIGKGLAPFKWR